VTRPTRPLRWWREALIVIVGYVMYTVVRNVQGEGTSAADYQHALNNAQRVVHLEGVVGLFHEHTVQRLFLRAPDLVRALDSFWAVAHFVVAAAVVVWLLRWHPDRYRALRTALALMTAVGLLCFAVYPTLPPRLMPASFGFIDTWAKVGGIGAHHPPSIERISDPFAAMPSLHLAWAVWCAAAVAPAMKRSWTKALAVAYPVVTFIAVVATGNHFLLDALAGALLAVLSLLVAGRFDRRWRGMQERAKSDGDDEEELELTLVGAARAAG
jgi:hypothetical protein